MQFVEAPTQGNCQISKPAVDTAAIPAGVAERLFHSNVFPDFVGQTYLQLPGETTTMSRTVWIWAAILAVIGSVFASIDHARRTDPSAIESAYSSRREAVSPGVPP
jgi:hypothetical protein